MPRALKGFLHFIFGLAVTCAFLYPRMAPMIRQSRAIQKARASAPTRPDTRGSGHPATELDRIVSFASDVTLRGDATLEVREEFVAHSEGEYFRYGMIRELPIDSEARWDRRFVGEWRKDTGIRVKILEVSRDGAPISYEQGSDSGYPQVRIGEPWVALAPGDHRFVLRYEADGVTQFLADGDQLYWNSVGHYWRLPVDEVVVRLHLPREVPAGVVAVQAYAGGRGATIESLGHFGAKQAERSAIANGFEFRVADLGAAQSLAFSSTWPKGFLAPPVLGPLSHDGGLLIAPALLLLYYVVVWFALGREPKRGAVAIQYQPPQGLSPAAMRYIRTMTCDGRTLAATIAQLGARGLVGVEPQGAKYKITRLGIDPKTLTPPLAPEELSLYYELFSDGATVMIDSSRGAPQNLYVNGIYREVHKAAGNLYFTRNARWLALGAFASFLTTMGMALTVHGRSADRMVMLFLTWWFFFCFFFLGLIAVMTLLPAWVRMMRGLGGAKEVLVGSLVVGVFGAGGGFVFWQLKSAASLAYAFSLVALVAINIAAFPALKRLTPRGRQVRDAIEGFRKFLDTVEQDRLRRFAPSDAHAASAEFLPCAIALDVREAWGDHLAEACIVTTTTAS